MIVAARMSDVVLFGVGRLRAGRARLPRRGQPARGRRVHGRTSATSTADELDGLPVVPFEALERDAIRRTSYAMFVAIGFSGVNQRARARSTSECKAARLRADQLRQLEGDVLGRARARRQLLRLRGERDPAERPDRQQRHPLERQPHRPRLDDRATTVFIASHAVISGQRHDRRVVASSASTRRSATAITVAPRCVIGAGALIMKDTEEGGVYSVRGHRAAREEELGADASECAGRSAASSCSSPPPLPVGGVARDGARSSSADGDGVRLLLLGARRARAASHRPRATFDPSWPRRCTSRDRAGARARAARRVRRQRRDGLLPRRGRGPQATSTTSAGPAA